MYLGRNYGSFEVHPAGLVSIDIVKIYIICITSLQETWAQIWQDLHWSQTQSQLRAPA